MSPIRHARPRVDAALVLVVRLLCAWAVLGIAVALAGGFR